MSKLGDLVMGLFMLATGAGLILVDNIFSGILSLTPMENSMPSYASFTIAGIAVIVLSIFYIVSVFINSEGKFFDNEEHTCTYCGDKLQGEKALKEHIKKYHQGENTNRMDFESNYEKNYQEDRKSVV